MKYPICKQEVLEIERDGNKTMYYHKIRQTPFPACFYDPVSERYRIDPEYKSCSKAGHFVEAKDEKNSDN